MTARLDVDAMARVLLGDGTAPVRARVVAARVHYRRQLIGRPPSRAEARQLRLAFDERRRVAVEMARAYRL